MAEKLEEKELKALSKRVTNIGKAYSDLMDRISYRTTGSSNDRRKELAQLSAKVDEIINDEMSSLTKYAGDDLSDFIFKLFNDTKNPGQNYMGGNIRSMEDLFKADDSTMVNYFVSKQKESRVLYNELDMISTQLYELKECINVTRDSIVTSDDISKTISRQISFSGYGEDELEESSALKQIEGMEKKFKLFKKIKNFVVPNTLRYGVYYVYTIPYSKLFEQYYKKKNEIQFGATNEAYTVSHILKEKNKDTVTEMSASLMESISLVVNESDAKIAVPKKSTTAEISTTVEQYLNNIEIYNDEIPLPLMEDGLGVAEMIDFRIASKKAIKDAEKRNSTGPKLQYSDGVKNNSKDTNFDSVTNDVYVKYISPDRMIPVKILDTTIGYYYVIDLGEDTLQPFSNTIKIVDAAMINKQTEDMFIQQLTNKVVQAFDKPFLQNNQKFKDLILNSLMYEDSYRKKLRFQFIPVDYVTEFTVNEDEDGNGQSVLKDSLFYAKLYLSLLIFKMLQILTKSSDTRVYYVKNSGLDADIMSGIQNAARQVKAKQINYYDIMNPITSTSKLGNNNEIFIPYGRSQEKGMEFDILQGQDVQLNNDLMEMLRQGYINATGVPSVIMQYINEADYAKTLVMANSKYTGRVISLQNDFNVSITEFYRKLAKFSTDLDESIIDSMEFVFVAPKTINTQNMNDLAQGTDQVVQYMIATYMGQNADVGEDGNKLKDRLTRKLSKMMLPTLPWDDLKDMAEEVYAEIQKEKLEAKNKNGEDSDEPAIPTFV